MTALMKTNLRNINTVCFTGHRPAKLGGYDPNPTSDWVKQALRNAIQRAVRKGVKSFISGGSLGVDQWAAEIVIEIKVDQTFHNDTWDDPIKLIIAQPFPGQSSKWPSESRRHYDKLLQKADKVIELYNGEYASWKMQKRNEWMVDNSEAMIAVWDGSPGGTKSCLDYALKQKKKRPILIIDPVKQSQKWFLDGKIE